MSPRHVGRHKTLGVRMLVASLFVFTLTATPAGAQVLAGASGPAGSGSPGGPQDSRLRRGATEWTVLAGGADAVSINHSRAGRQFVMQAVQWGKTLSGPRGPRPLRGHLELLVEVVPLFVMFQSQRAYGYGASPIFVRWNFGTPRRLQPFVEILGGVLRTDRQVPEGTRRRNFTAQTGLGFRVWSGTRRAVLFGYRFHHLSNAGPGEINPSVNSNFVYLGIAWLR